MLSRVNGALSHAVSAAVRQATSRRYGISFLEINAMDRAFWGLGNAAGRHPKSFITAEIL
ncbi:hypothetical protein ABK905_04305 [Acerihabitans sp. KWT182]|uniref:Uncharacterized protein n=1 Tax=Acerihabitans sp. KWT182 TaxID=3157919 RepID=A0AAU7QC15_9GAMM